METINVIKGNYFIDGFPTYEGYSSGNKWNGWECPMFTKEVAIEILKGMEDSGDVQEWNANEPSEDGSIPSISYVDYDGYLNEARALTVNCGKNELTVYPIGNYDWCWTSEEDVDLDNYHPVQPAKKSDPDPAEEISALKKNLLALKYSLNTISEIWINDATGAVEAYLGKESGYPFEKSFDEIALDVNRWIENSIDKMNSTL